MFLTPGGYTVSGAADGGFSHAAWFTSAASGRLAIIEVALGDFGLEGPNSYTATLYADGGGMPGAALESFMLAGVPDQASAYTPETLTSAARPMLTAGSSYWVGIVANDPATAGAWAANSTGASGPLDDVVIVPSGLLPAFAVDVSAVPEPSVLALGLVGMAGAIGYRVRRRRKAEAAR